MTKRILPVLLALCMLLSLAPAVFAEPTQTAAPSASAQEPAEVAVLAPEQDEALILPTQQADQTEKEKTFLEELRQQQEQERQKIREKLQKDFPVRTQPAGPEPVKSEPVKSVPGKYIWLDTDESWYQVEYGETLTLHVDTYSGNDESVGDLNVKYQWYDADSGAKVNSTTDTYTTAKIVRNRQYRCEATDKYGDTANQYFYVNVENHLSVESAIGSTEIYVEEGKTATLKVKASATNTDGMTYQWYKVDENGYCTPIENATAVSYTTPAVKKRQRYLCTATDKFGNSESIDFIVGVDNEFSVADAESGGIWASRYVTIGEKTTLKVVVTAKDKTGLTYEWSRYNEDTWTYEVNANVTGASLTTGAIRERRSYQCRVTDKYGNQATVDFGVYPDNKLTAVSTRTNEYYDVRGIQPETAATLKVSVSALDESKLTWKWYRVDENWNWNELSVTGLSLTTGKIRERRRYIFQVEDQYGNTDTVTFELYAENKLTAVSARNGNEYDERGVAAEATASLKVSVSALDESKLTCKWYRAYDGKDPIQLSATGLSLSTGKIRERRRYIFVVEDQYGNSAGVEFVVYVDNQLHAYADSNTVIRVSAGSTATLKVKTSATVTDGITYQWYRSYEKADGSYVSGPVSGAVSASLTTAKIYRANDYWCQVTDKFGNTATVSFQVSVENHFSDR